MKNLLEKRTAAVNAMRALLDKAKEEDREFTAEEAAEFDRLEGEHEALSAQIGRVERLEAAEFEQTQVRQAVGRGNIAGPRIAGGDVKRDWESLGEFVAAVRFRPNDPRLNYVENAITGNPIMDMGAAVEMRMDDGPHGGFMVPKRFLTTIRSVPPQQAIVRPRAAVIGSDGGSPDAAVGIPVWDQTGSTQPASNFAGATGSWISEGALKPQTDAALREVELVPKEFAGHMIVTDKLLRNWQGASAMIERIMRDVMISAEDTAFISGSGVGQPLGILNSAALYSESRAGAGAIATDDIQQMLSRFLIRGGSPGSAVWSVSQSTLPSLFSLKGGNNENIWVANLAPDYPGTLFGIPVIVNNRQPALGTKGDVILADWSYYIIKDGSGPFVMTSEHVYFTSNKTVIKFFFNVDGAPWLSGTFKEENGYEVSPFVTLAT